jgi:hypothetical protein
LRSGLGEERPLVRHCLLSSRTGTHVNSSSAIIKHLISLRDAGHASLAYFYFDSQDKAKQSTSNFVASLLTQLAASSERCCKIIFRLYSTHGNGKQQPNLHVLTDCLKEMLFAAAQKPIYIIVDALDECPGFRRVSIPLKEVPKLLKDLVRLGVSNLHICVTGRPNFNIETHLGPLLPRTVSLHNENGQQDDIRDYLTNIVYSDKIMKKWQDIEKKLVVNELSKKANGKYEYPPCSVISLLI